MWSWINGRIQPVSEGTINVIDHGFTVGDGVFETLKTVEGVPFALTRHLRRLNRSAAGLGLPPVDEKTVRRAVAELLDVESHPLGVLRITYTSGPGPLGSNRGPGPLTLACVTMPTAALARHHSGGVESLAPQRALAVEGLEDHVVRRECGVFGRGQETGGQ